MHQHGHDDPNAKKLYELIKDVKIAMMTTAEGGKLTRAPCTTWTRTNMATCGFLPRSARRRCRNSLDSEVSLGYSDPSSQTYVAVTGRAEIVRDKAKIDEKWSEPLKAWFPKGKDDPEIALLRVHPERGEFWDTPSSTIVHLVGYVKAAVTGERADPGDHAKVDLHG